MHETATQVPQLEAGIFATVSEASRAVEGLLRAGFTTQQVTVVCSDETKERYFRDFEHQHPAGTNTPKAVVAGGTIGALVGGVTVVASAAATGSLALWAAGPITALTGAIAGSLVGAMATRGVEKELANFYQQAVLDGNILVAAEVKASNEVVGTRPTLEEAARILAAAGAKPLPLPEG